jgi:hypothetical protein
MNFPVLDDHTDNVEKKNKNAMTKNDIRFL